MTSDNPSTSEIYSKAPTPFRFALVMVFLSGVAGLAHQIVWTRRLVDLLGASADTFSKVIGAFFLGLALGAWLGARPVKQPHRLWLRVALAEAIVAGLALLLLIVTPLITPTTPFAIQFIKWGLPMLLVIPPAIAMGTVLPWLFGALSTVAPLRPGQPVTLYALNTFGGVLGIIGILLFALPRWGLFGAGVAAIALNLIVAAIAFGLHWRNSSSMAAEKSTTAPDASPLGLKRSFILLAFASGFLVLALEVILQHQFAQITINSLFSSATVLIMVLIALALAAALTPLLARLAKDHALPLVLLATVLACAAQPQMLSFLSDGLVILPYEEPAGVYTSRVALLGLLAAVPVFFTAGFVFPLLLREVAASGCPRVSRRIAALLAWNGLGGWLGAEFAQGWLVPQFGLWLSLSLIAVGYAALILLAKLSRSWRIGLAGGCIVVACLAFVVSRPLPQVHLKRSERLAALNVGREGVVATVECGRDDWRMLFNNSYTLGGSRAKFNQERQALLPVLMHGAPKSVGILGVATGSTTAGAALHPSVEHIEAVELSPLVLQYAQEFFGPYNRNVFQDPRARFIQEDARWVMAARPAAYDVVVGDLFLPWRTGEGRLFAREHFQNVQRSLKSGGLYCQWLPLFQLTRPQVETIVRTFREVFPDAYFLRGDFYTELPILGLVGGKKLSDTDWEKIETACAQIRTANQVTDPLVRHAEGVAMLVLGPVPVPPAGPINTLGNAWLEWNAGQNILGLKTPWFIGIPCAEYVRDIHRATQPLIPAKYRAAHDAGQFFLTLEVAAKLQLPMLEDLRSQVPQRLPEPMRRDAQADWAQWPMRVKPTPEMLGPNP